MARFIDEGGLRLLFGDLKKRLAGKLGKSDAAADSDKLGGSPPDAFATAAQGRRADNSLQYRPFDGSQIRIRDLPWATGTFADRSLPVGVSTHNQLSISPAVGGRNARKRQDHSNRKRLVFVYSFWRVLH